MADQTATVQPTVGRVVHLYRLGDTGGPFAAIVTEVSVTALCVFAMRPGCPGESLDIPRQEGVFRERRDDKSLFEGWAFCWRWPPRVGP